MDKNSRILIVGHDDILEHSLKSFFENNGYGNVFSASVIGLNPAIQTSVYDFFQKHKPEYVFLGSTRSGGIEANKKNEAEFIYHNSEGQNNILYSSWKFGARKLLYFASSCVYPKECSQPMAEDQILTGPLEKTSEFYSVAKIAGIRMCQAFKRQYGFNAIVMIPATIYGPGSNVNIETAHVIGALIGKFSDALKNHQREVCVWGSGNPRREFLYVDDFVDASMYLMKHYNGEKVVNIGCGDDLTIKELAEMIAGIIGFKGKIVFDTTKPDGAMKKLLDSRFMISLGWKPQVSLEEGIQKMFEWYKNK